MEWTDEVPTEGGSYWARDRENNQSVVVIWRSSKEDRWVLAGSYYTTAQVAALCQIGHRIPEPDELEALINRVAHLEAAIYRVAKWHGEFPATGQFWDDDPTRPMSYSTCYGSNGERDFMREIARQALANS